LNNLCEPVPFFYDHIALIDRDNIYHQSLIDSFADGVTDVELEKKLILGIAYASKLFSKTHIVPAEIIVLECTDDFWPKDMLADVLKDSLLYKGAKFQITNYGYHWQYRVDGITPSTQTTVVTENTDFVVRKIDTLETTQMHPQY
jgi:hypothetical protein